MVEGEVSDLIDVWLNGDVLHVLSALVLAIRPRVVEVSRHVSVVLPLSSRVVVHDLTSGLRNLFLYGELFRSSLGLEVDGEEQLPVGGEEGREAAVHTGYELVQGRKEE